MGTYIFFIAAALAGISVPILLPRFRKYTPEFSSAFLWLLYVLPFCIGGFYNWLAVPVSGLLICYLIFYVYRNKRLSFRLNLSSAAIISVFLGFCITPLWAADKGMSVFGIIKYLPIVLYLLLLMQMPSSGRSAAFRPVPVCGALMTLLSFILQFIPSLSDSLTVNGRLAGFMQYPNTFAVYLLAGLIIQGTKEQRSLWDVGMDFLLICGIFLSGSRTAFILLIAAVLFIVVFRRNIKFTIILSLLFFLSLSISYLLSQTAILSNSDRFTAISLTSSTFLGRLLYYKDALGIIIKRPFGLGYGGYQALEGSFQTGRYSIAFVHNGLLQLLLDIGWIPAILAIGAVIKTFFSKNVSLSTKGLLLIILAHCMFDFDMQYLIIWFLIIPTLDLGSGKEISIRISAPTAAAVCIPILALSIWLGIGDFLYYLGNTSASLSVTPFHTQALIQSLTQESVPARMDEIGSKIIKLNPHSSIAHSAKADAAFTNGDILSMITYKETAIHNAKYSINEYCDYIDKLYIAYQLYLQANDPSSAQYCLSKILSVEQMIRTVNASTDPLADLLSDSSLLTLPEEYQALLHELHELTQDGSY